MKLYTYLKIFELALFVVFTTFSSVNVFAHHSQAAFDASQIITFEGTVHRLDWKNPHIYLIVETQDANGQAILQQIEGLAITQARVDGLEPNALQPGTKVRVRANPNRGGAGKTVRGLNVTTADGRVHPFYERAAQERQLLPAQSISGKWAPSLAETNRVFAIAYGQWQYTEAGRSGELIAGCAIEPIPFLAVINELRIIDVSDEVVSIQHDNSGDIGVRKIDLGMEVHPQNIEPSNFGHSIGRWEGETLVIDTIGYTANASGSFSGVPSGTQKHTVERLTLSADGKQLRYDFSMEDPEFLLEPASFTMLWDHRPDLTVSTEPCELEISNRYLED